MATVISGSFTITVTGGGGGGGGGELVFTAQPVSTPSGQTLPSVEVAWMLGDGSGNPDPANTAPITMSIASGAGTLGGTLTQTPVNGVASFGDLVITATTTGDFTLQAAG